MEFCTRNLLLLVLIMFNARGWAAAPPDQNFDAISAQSSANTSNPSITFDNVVYSTNASSDELRVDSISALTGGFTTLGTGNGISAAWIGDATTTFFKFASVNNVNNFKMVSLRAEVWGGSSNTSELYTIGGYNDGSLVVSAVVNFTADGTYGSGTSAIIYDRQTTPSEDASNQANAGLLTFGSA